MHSQNRSPPLAEITVVADIERRELTRPPSVFCHNDRLILDEELRAHLPEHVSAGSGSQIINTHEGVKMARSRSKDLFSEIPIEAAIPGQHVTISGSNAPPVQIDRHSGELTVTVADAEYSVPTKGSLEQEFSVEVDATSRDVSLTVQMNDLGEVEVLSHPTKSVVPAESTAAAYYKTLAAKSAGSENVRENGPSSERGDIHISEVRNENVLLVDRNGGEPA